VVAIKSVHTGLYLTISPKGDLIGSVSTCQFHSCLISPPIHINNIFILACFNTRRPFYWTNFIFMVQHLYIPSKIQKSSLPNFIIQIWEAASRLQSACKTTSISFSTASSSSVNDQYTITWQNYLNKTYYTATDTFSSLSSSLFIDFLYIKNLIIN